MRLTLPLKTVNRTNSREHWGETAKRTKRERNAVGLLLKPRLGELGPTRLVVTLTRTGPNELDDDGLRAALKGVRDGAAAALRIDDSSPLVRWDYSQRQGQHSVEVMITWETRSDWDLAFMDATMAAPPVDNVAKERIGKLLREKREAEPTARRIRRRVTSATYRNNDSPKEES